MDRKDLRYIPLPRNERRMSEAQAQQCRNCHGRFWDPKLRKVRIPMLPCESCGFPICLDCMKELHDQQQKERRELDLVHVPSSASPWLHTNYKYNGGVWCPGRDCAHWLKNREPAWTITRCINETALSLILDLKKLSNMHHGEENSSGHSEKKRARDN